MLEDQHPELIRKIAEHCVEGRVSDGMHDGGSAVDDQTTLARLIRIKTFHPQALPLLYEDCLVTRPADFHDVLTSKPEAFKSTKRLRFGDGPMPAVSLYGAILPDHGHGPLGPFRGPQRWAFVDVKTDPQESTPLDQVTINAYCLDWLSVTRAINNLFIDELLPSLLQVVMNRMTQPDLMDYYSFQPNYSKPEYHENALATSLAGICVRAGTLHYCQSDVFGNFALPLQVLKVPTPPKVVTFHLPDHVQDMSDFKPPIVLGAINRYIYAWARLSFVQPPFLPGSTDISDLTTGVMIGDLIRQERGHAFDDSVSTQDPRELDWTGTIIELYNYVERVYKTPNSRSRPGPGPHVVPTIDGYERASLEPLQQYLDRHLSTKDVKVYVKTLEECPPCTACGLEYRLNGV